MHNKTVNFITRNYRTRHKLTQCMENDVAAKYPNIS